MLELDTYDFADDAGILPSGPSSIIALQYPNHPQTTKHRTGKVMNTGWEKMMRAGLPTVDVGVWNSDSKFFGGAYGFSGIGNLPIRLSRITPALTEATESVEVEKPESDTMGAKRTSDD